MQSDDAWYDDLGVLARRPDEFWPAQRHSPEERLNALVRLVAYVSAAVFLYRTQAKFVAFGFAAVAALSLAHWRRGREEPPPPSRAGGRARAQVGKKPVAGPPCTLSTPDNPFANMLVSDLATNPGRPAACKYEDQADLVEENFNMGTVRNMYDVYDRENGRRQFVTMPVTTASADTLAFARFCYGNQGRSTCKEDPARCTGAFP
jgi:hypothetical protein